MGGESITNLPPMDIHTSGCLLALNTLFADNASFHLSIFFLDSLVSHRPLVSVSLSLSLCLSLCLSLSVSLSLSLRLILSDQIGGAKPKLVSCTVLDDGSGTRDGNICPLPFYLPSCSPPLPSIYSPGKTTRTKTQRRQQQLAHSSSRSFLFIV